MIHTVASLARREQNLLEPVYTHSFADNSSPKKNGEQGTLRGLCAHATREIVCDVYIHILRKVYKVQYRDFSTQGKGRTRLGRL